MNFDIDASDNVTGSLSSLPVLQHVSVQIMPAGGGHLNVSLTGVFLDEECLELISGDLDGASVSSVEEVLAVIRRTLIDAFEPAMPKEDH
jgi:hypothetical protein